MTSHKRILCASLMSMTKGKHQIYTLELRFTCGKRMHWRIRSASTLSVMRILYARLAKRWPNAIDMPELKTVMILDKWPAEKKARALELERRRAEQATKHNSLTKEQKQAQFYDKLNT